MTAETKEKTRGEKMAASEQTEARGESMAALEKAETRGTTMATLSKAGARGKTMGDSSEVKTRGKTVETEPGRILVCSDEADVRSYVVQSEDAGVRVDVLLSRVFSDLSRSRVQQMLTEGGVTLLAPDGDTRAGSKYGPCIVSKSYKVKDGDRLSLEVYDLVPIDAAPEDIPIDIVYEDEDLVVVDKPQGMVVHPAYGHADGTLVNALLYHCKLSSINGRARPGIVHRIDKDTSGLLVVAKTDLAHVSLAADFAKHDISRKYLAIATGRLMRSEGTIDAPIGRDPSNRKRYAVVAGGKTAITHYRMLEEFPGYTLLELELETGRTHQIRVHMKYTGNPLAGDALYGKSGGEGQYLHASTLGFKHPRTGEKMLFETQPPEYFADFLCKLRGIGD